MKKKLSFRRFTYYLLSVSIIVSCITNGIFAKFTTENAGGDGARVAKFGIVLNVAGDMFSAVYNKHADNDEIDPNTSEVVFSAEKSNLPTLITASDNAVSVRATANKNANGEITGYDNVVAPGTKGANGLNITIKGTAETDSTITATTDVETVYLHGKWGLFDTLPYYGIMVELNDDVIRLDNFEEFKDILYVKTIEGEISTYEKLEASDEFTEGTKYYKVEDECYFEDDCYMPIKYRVYYKDGNEFKEEDVGTNKAVWGELIPDLNDLITGAWENVSGWVTGPDRFDFQGTITSDVYETGATIDKEIYVTWEWPFSVNEKYSAYDTILGHLAAGNPNVVRSLDDRNTYKNDLVEGLDYNLDIDFAVDIAINQVD